MNRPDGGYAGTHAEFYDRQVGPDDSEDVDFYVDRARPVDGPVLEMACGTGRVYLALLEAGVDADGFDLSMDALDVLRRNAVERGLDPTVWQDDMADFDTGREYDLVICPFNAFQHLRRVEDQQSALRCVHDALAPGGEFVFDVFVPGFDVICGTYGEWQTDTVQFRGEPHEVRNRSRITDEVEQYFAVEVEVYDQDDERVIDVEHELTMLPKREVALLAELSPFEEWSVTGDFDGEPIEDGDVVQVWALEK